MAAEEAVTAGRARNNAAAERNGAHASVAYDGRGWYLHACVVLAALGVRWWLLHQTDPLQRKVMLVVIWPVRDADWLQQVAPPAICLFACLFACLLVCLFVRLQVAVVCRAGPCPCV